MNARSVTSASRRKAALLLSVTLSALLLYALYRSIDVRGVGRVLRQADAVWVAIALGIIIPITIARAMRFTWLLPASARRGLVDATVLTLISASFNVFLPAKAGDFAKSVIIAKREGGTGPLAVAVVLYERLADLVGMLVWCVGGYFVVRPVAPLVPLVVWLGLAVTVLASATLMLSERVADLVPRAVRTLSSNARFERIVRMAEAWPSLLAGFRGRRLWLMIFSIALWFVQLFQIWLFTVAVGVHVPFGACASLAAIALIVGQLPITLGGIGTRDIALVLLLSAYMSPEQAAAVGILTTLRGILLPIAGLPLMRSYLVTAMRSNRTA